MLIISSQKGPVPRNRASAWWKTPSGRSCNRARLQSCR